MLQAADTPAVVLGCDQPALEVAGEAVVSIHRFSLNGYARSGGVAHAAVVVDVAEQQVSAVAPPEGALGWTFRAAEPGAVFFNGGVGVDYRVQGGGKLLNGHGCAS